MQFTTVKFHNATTTAGVIEVLFESRVPFYGTIIIASVGCILLVCCCFWMFLRLCHRRSSKRRGLLKMRLATPSLKMLQESTQPDLDNLLDKFDDENASKSADFVGRLHFAIEYSLKNSNLMVTVIEACELAAMDIGGTSDPYVKVRLLPYKKPVFCTKVVKENCNPLFNETFTFEAPITELPSLTLLFQVFDQDFLSADDRIGNVIIPLSSIDLTNLVVEWRDLVKAGIDSADKTITPGDICVSLRYVPAANLLTVVVIEAKNLPRTEDGDDTDYFVKLTLCLEGKRVKRKRSTVIKSCRNPYFNETFTFEVTYQFVKKGSLEIALCTPHFLKSKRVGFIEIGSDVPSASQALHWKDMLANQRHSIARWHSLQSP